MSLDEPTDEKRIIKTFGTILSDNSDVKRQLESGKFKASNASYKLDDLPKNFDGRDVWRYYLSPIFDQGYCGNCWAVASVGMLSDRFSLLSKNYIKPYLSSSMATLCDRVIGNRPVYDPQSISDLNIKEHAEGSCFGNSITNALKFLYVYGAVDNNCLNYGYLYNKGVNIRLDKAQGSDTLPNCQDIIGKDYDSCAGNIKVAARYYRASTYYTLEGDEMTIKREIFKFGPIVSGFIIYNDFLNEYDGLSIYMGPKEGAKPTGGHAIRCVGWGEEMVKSKDKEGKEKEELVKYWIIANSWGPQWGDGGYFKLKIGIPELKFEQNAAAAFPDLPFLDNPYINELAVNDPESLVKRKNFDVDQITGYINRAIPLIKKEELYGVLVPMFPEDLKYSLEEFVAGKITLFPEVYVQLRKASKNFNYIYYLTFFIGLFIFSIISFIIFRKLK
jgi:hypothetical protein